jgi:hypothetical protein
MDVMDEDPFNTPPKYEEKEKLLLDLCVEIVEGVVVYSTPITGEFHRIELGRWAYYAKNPADAAKRMAEEAVLKLIRMAENG